MKRFAVLCLLMACSPPMVVPTDGGVTPDGLLHRGGLPNNHVASCTQPAFCGDGAEPPLGGPHCSSWLPCRHYTEPQNRCEWVHNLEHGHAVLAFNCAPGAECTDIENELLAIFTAKPLPRRILVVPDPMLPTKVAAMVWGWGWAGDHVDAAKIADVLARQDAEAPEAGLGCTQ